MTILRTLLNLYYPCQDDEDLVAVIPGMSDSAWDSYYLYQSKSWLGDYQSITVDDVVDHWVDFDEDSVRFGVPVAVIYQDTTLPRIGYFMPMYSDEFGRTIVFLLYDPMPDPCTDYVSVMVEQLAAGSDIIVKARHVIQDTKQIRVMCYVNCVEQQGH